MPLSKNFEQPNVNRESKQDLLVQILKTRYLVCCIIRNIVHLFYRVLTRIKLQQVLDTMLMALRVNTNSLTSYISRVPSPLGIHCICHLGISLSS